MYIFNAPDWFIGYDVFLELAFAVITLIVSLYAFKVYRIAEHKRTELFGIAFLLISISYFLQSFLNMAILSNFNNNICSALNINNLISLNYVEFHIHIVFFLLGLLTLAYMTLKISSKKAYILMATMLFLTVFLSPDHLIAFYFLSTVLLLFISIQYLLNYINNREHKTLLVLLGFLFLLFGSIHFLLSVNHAIFYVISHILELVAYTLILINLILVVKK